jgi:hypothetical protein
VPPSPLAPTGRMCSTASIWTPARVRYRPRSPRGGDSAASAFEEQVKATPDNSQLYVLPGTTLTYAGRKDEAVREGKLAVEHEPITKDVYGGAYNQHRLARIYILVDEPDKARAGSSHCSSCRTTSRRAACGSTRL